MAPEFAQAISINTLDFRLTGSPIIDCELLSKFDLEHDPSWTNEQFYIRMIEEYNVSLSGGHMLMLTSFGKISSHLSRKTGMTTSMTIFFTTMVCTTMMIFSII